VETARLDAAKLMLRGLPFLVDDSDYVTSAMLKMKAMAYSSREDTSMMITDFAELVADAGADDETREQQVSGIYRSHRSISRSLNIPAILLAQYNRGPMERDSKMGHNSDIRYSGMAEIAADQIIHIYSPWQLTQMQTQVQPPRDMPVIDNIAYIVCGKNRDGPIGYFRLRWQPRWTRWSDLSEPADDFAQIIDDGDF
jgi:replicative DNA helicase